MRLGINVGGSAHDLSDLRSVVPAADRLGIDSAWIAETWGADAATPLAYLAALTSHISLGTAIMQIPARSAKVTANIARTMNAVSDGRFRLGLGMSGPQVVEGWHGVPYGRPLATTRQYVADVRAALAGMPADPTSSADTSGEREVPIFLAAIGPKNIALTAETANGWLPLFYSPEHEDIFREPLAEGLARRQPSLGRLQVATTIFVSTGADVAGCRDEVRPMLALYIGGMGAKDANFYNALIQRYGYEEVAATVQDRFLSGDREGAVKAVPDDLVDELTLVGPTERILDRLEAWKETEVTEIVLLTTDLKLLESVREALG